MHSVDRVSALEKLVAQYEKSRMDFAAIQEELRTLPASPKLDDMLAANAETLASVERMLAMTRERLHRERLIRAANAAMANGHREAFAS
ncbi:MAG TPA: hypothetical protein VM029_11855 [Opitutaceae bacterium]|nr:hypothetical protein [Opitutaceae bacterium]